MEKRYRVRFEGKLDLGDYDTVPPKGTAGKEELKGELLELQERMNELQSKMYAEDRHSLLVMFQAMDAAGKDGTIRQVFKGVDPAGMHVTSFKAPSSEELDHDFMWRHVRHLPERGRIGVFNRSWYEEVLITRVVPEILAGQRLPRVPDDVFEQRYESIRDFERHLARNGTTVLKFYLHVSPAVQRERLLARLDDPEKNWKFEAGDLDSRERWTKYAKAYEAALSATSRSNAPWYVVPADHKGFTRVVVARIVVATLEKLDLQWPVLDPAEQSQLAAMRLRLG